MRASIFTILTSFTCAVPALAGIVSPTLDKGRVGNTTPESLIIPNSNLGASVPSSSTPFYIALSQQVFNAQNRARVDPLSFSKELALYGDAEAAAICANAPAIANGNLLYVGSLRLAAAMHVNDQGPLGLLGHISSNGMTAFQRYDLFGTWRQIAGENIMYGPYNAMGVMAGLIKSPEHYANIFRSSFKVAGISCGAHLKYGTECVIAYAGSFSPLQK